MNERSDDKDMAVGLPRMNLLFHQCTVSAIKDVGYKLVMVRSPL